MVSWMCQAEPSEIESEPSGSQSVDSIYETALEHKSETSEEEDPLPLEFLRSIEPDVFEDFGNTSRYFCQKRPPSPVTPTDPVEEDFLRETIQELTTLISNEWLQEGEASVPPIYLNSPSHHSVAVSKIKMWTLSIVPLSELISCQMSLP